MEYKGTYHSVYDKGVFMLPSPSHSDTMSEDRSSAHAPYLLSRNQITVSWRCGCTRPFLGCVEIISLSKPSAK
jgi:hypothetical protein